MRQPRESFFNTENVSGKTLDKREGKAKNQEQIILEWFENYEQAAIPSKVRRLVFANRVPITSVRRAMTNLTKAGFLEKTGKQITGKHNHLEHLWSLPKGQTLMDLWR